MKKYKYPVFSNGTEFELWMADNCDRCVKASRYNEKTDTYTKFRCSVHREIIAAYLDDGRASERTYNICQNADCMALAMMKELERRRSKEFVSVKTDHNTIVTASESRLKELGIEGIRI